MNTPTQAPTKSTLTKYSPAARLAYYKALTAHYEGRHNRPLDWKYYRSWAKPLALDTGKYSAIWSEDRQTIFVDDLKDCPFNFEGDAHELAKIDHTGWYADQCQDNLVKGAVMSFRNPGRLYGEDDNTGNQTHKVFLAAYYETDADGATIDYSHFYETARDAAYAADRLAERAAEKEREYQAKDQAERDIEELKGEIHTLNKETLALIKDVRQQASTFPSTVCDVIRGHIYNVRKQRREKFKRIAALKNDYWLAVE